MRRSLITWRNRVFQSVCQPCGAETSYFQEGDEHEEIFFKSLCNVSIRPSTGTNTYIIQ